MIASPQDVSDERSAVPSLFSRWNVEHAFASVYPVMWEDAAVPELGEHPQRVLDRQLVPQCELLVGIFWCKLGTPTPTQPSGTVEEIHEFIKTKGPRRVMLYFCTRDLPSRVDLAEVQRVRAFKEEMKQAGVYQEYLTLSDFATHLRRHLTVKVRELVNGELPLPTAAGLEDTGSESPAPSQFGSTLPDIAVRFATRMDEFDAIQGTGPRKYLALGAEVYTAVADSIDRAIPHSGLKFDHRAQLNDLSTRLKRLAADYKSFVDRPFPEYWQLGRRISDDLSTEVQHLRRLGRLPT